MPLLTMILGFSGASTTMPLFILTMFEIHIPPVMASLPLLEYVTHFRHTCSKFVNFGKKKKINKKRKPWKYK